ncbi:hypothetical protein PtA15_4A470 [Puccinia triticina]|uniref:Uncharacterized protein n=1 Tax=Puccinia triticina TaxID=208348 RepID=A0ABY7CFZ4_9BASI|nr:uncharacterized protein PtA15_4A470 [Puccinia triticina]WAQ84019.1 hypothetical protein PtA15_4A470 [Puccinia triticina]
MVDTSSNQHPSFTESKPKSNINPAFRFLGIVTSWLKAHLSNSRAGAVRIPVRKVSATPRRQEMSSYLPQLKIDVQARVLPAFQHFNSNSTTRHI